MDTYFSKERPEVDPADARMAQWSYLFSALSVVTSVSLQMFHYRSASNYYSDGDVLGTNWWKLAAWVKGYGALTLWGMALLF